MYCYAVVMSSMANGACMNLCVAAWRLEAIVITLPAQENTLRLIYLLLELMCMDLQWTDYFRL